MICDQVDIENVTEALKTGPYGKCVYDTDNDVMSHQVKVFYTVIYFLQVTFENFGNAEGPCWFEKQYLASHGYHFSSIVYSSVIQSIDNCISVSTLLEIFI